MSSITDNIRQHIASYRALQAGDDKVLVALLRDMSRFHYENSEVYRRILGFTKQDGALLEKSINTIEELPFIHAMAFKNKLLSSVNDSEISLILSSSGTSGTPSRIPLSVENARHQKLGLANIINEFLGTRRPTMIMMDTDLIMEKKAPFSARKAGIVGFGQLSKKYFFALDSSLSIDEQKIVDALRSTNDIVVMYGFTSVIWNAITAISVSRDLQRELSSRCILVHGGGWKKMEAKRVSKQQFNQKVRSSLGISDIRNYYGMVEQTGSIFLECEYGNLHENYLTRIVPRSLSDIYKKGAEGEECVCQVLSTLPSSYPGHSILTDDLVVITGKDACRCGRMGVTFEIRGRMKESEARGCSDVYK